MRSESITPAASAQSPTLLEVHALSKSYGGVHAVAAADLELREGEIVALVGSNGAGKSTLISLLSGVAAPDSGDILLGGKPVTFRSPADARALGVETVYQTLALIDTLDISQNIFLGREEYRGAGFWGWLADRRMRARARQLLETLGLSIDTRKNVAALSGGQRQAVALARAMQFETKIVILDEPTAALGVQETRATLDIVDRFRKEGLAVLLVSHNMTDVFELADRIVVMRGGRTIVTVNAADTNQKEVVGWITSGLEGDKA